MKISNKNANFKTMRAIRQSCQLCNDSRKRVKDIGRITFRLSYSVVTGIRFTGTYICAFTTAYVAMFSVNKYK